MSDLILEAAGSDPGKGSGLRMLATAISLMVLYVASAPSAARLSVPLAGAGLIAVIATARLTLRHKSWLICLLVLEEILPYLRLIPADLESRWVYRYPLLLSLCLPMLPVVWNSGILLQGRFKQFALYHAWCAVTISYSLVPAISAGRLLPSVLLFCTLGALALEVQNSEDIQRILGCFLLGCGLLLAMVTIGALVLAHDFNWVQDGRIERFSGILGGPNELGGLMIAATSAGLVHWKSTRGLRRAGTAFVIVSSLLLAAMANSRSAFLALAGGAALYAMWRYRARGVLVCLALALIAVVAWMFLDPELRAYFNRGVDTLTGRTEAWQFEVKAMMRRPATGYGYQVEGRIFQDRYFTNWESFWNRGADTPLHNGYLSIAVGVGIPALLFWVFVFLSPWFALFRRREDPWGLKPIALLVVAPMLIMGLDESWIDTVRYPRGILLMVCWMLAERQRLLAIAASARARPSEHSRFSALVAVTGCVALAAGIVLRPARLMAAEYYVDSSAGSDSNPATSPSAPWKTIAKVNSVRFSPGDVISFKRGGYWREMLKPQGAGAAGQPIVFGAYGIGPPPLISGAELINGWRSAGGAIYGATLSGPADRVHNVYVDGGPGWGLPRADGADSMRPGSWSLDQQNATLYVWLADGSNPAAHTIEAATRIAGFYANVSDDQASYIVVRGLRVQRTAGYGIYFHSYAGVTGLRGIVIQNNTVTQTGTGRADHGQYYNAIMLLQEPELDTAPQILGNRVSFSGGHGNAINCQSADHARIADNDVSNWNHNGIDVKNARDVVVEDNTAHDQRTTGAGFYCEYLSGVAWRRNTVYNASNGFQVGPGSQATLSDNSIHNVGTAVYFGPRAAAVTIESNVVNRATLAIESDGNGIVTSDYNNWSVDPKFHVGEMIYSLSEWQALGHWNDTGL